MVEKVEGRIGLRLLIYFNKVSRTFLERNVPKMSILDAGMLMGTKKRTHN